MCGTGREDVSERSERLAEDAVAHVCEKRRLPEEGEYPKALPEHGGPCPENVYEPVKQGKGETAPAHRLSSEGDSEDVLDRRHDRHKRPADREEGKPKRTKRKRPAHRRRGRPQNHRRLHAAEPHRGEHRDRRPPRVAAIGQLQCIGTLWGKDRDDPPLEADRDVHVLRVVAAEMQ